MNSLTIILLFLFCFYGILIVLLNYYKTLISRIQKLNKIQSKVYKSKFGDIEYFLTGKGPTILISHGVTGGIDQGMGLAQTYLGNGYQLLFISRFGYLKSSIPNEASAKLQASAYNELLQYLGIKSVFIFGNSAGGPSAMHFAIDYSEKCNGLILLSSAVPEAQASMPPDFIFKSNFFYWLTTNLAGKSLMKMFVPAEIIKTLSKQQITKLMNDIFVGALPISKRSKGIIFDNRVSTPSVDAIPFEQIKLPTLIIHATDDPAPPIFGAKKIAEKVNNSTIITFDGGHLILHHEKEIQKEIRKFITTL